MRQAIRRYMSWVLTAILCVCMLPTAALEAAESPAGKSIDIPVEVTAEGAVPTAPETYTVVLEAVNNGPLPEGASENSAEIQIQGPGEGTFTIDYSAQGVYEYKIYQKAGEKSNCTYDAAEYKLYVYVTYAADGSLDINAYMDTSDEEGKPEKVVFNNVYKGSAKFDPPLQKIVDVESGTAPTDSIFTFQMIPSDPSDPMPENDEAKHDSETGALTMDVKGPGSYEFGWMYFNETHCGKTFVYTVKEIDNGESGYTYDRNIYKLTVKVVPSDDGIALQTFYTDETGEVSEMKFTNGYKGKEEEPSVEPEKPEEPEEEEKKPVKKPSHKSGGGKKSGKSGSKVKTGDETNIPLWASVVGISLIAVLLLLFLKKKSSKDS